MKKSKTVLSFDKRLLNIICVFCLLFAGFTVGYFLYKKVMLLPPKSGATVEWLEDVSNKQVGRYKYANLFVTITEEYVSGEQYGYSYAYSTNKVDSKRGYYYSDTEGNELKQVWSRVNGEIDMYVYGNEVSVWVKPDEVVKEEPFVADIWSVVSSLEGYELLPETDLWNNEECYVLCMYGSADEYSLVGEELYIRCSDLLPVSCVTYITRDASGSISKDITEELKSLDSDIEDADLDSENRDQYMQIYEFVFSNEDMALFEIPDIAVDEATYYDLVDSLYETDKE